MEFLAGTASQGQVHQDRLRGLLTQVEECPAAIPFKAISPAALVERATSALTKPVNPLYMILAIKFRCKPYWARGDRAPPKARICGMTQPEVSSHVNSDRPVTFGTPRVIYVFPLCEKGVIISSQYYFCCNMRVGTRGFPHSASARPGGGKSSPMSVAGPSCSVTTWCKSM